uniref:Uncharacterized protein n=1 Tax=Anguilla anguilla TaxID=7936 RepID=A0A0E9QGK4_ANGAN
MPIHYQTINSRGTICSKTPTGI